MDVQNGLWIRLEERCADQSHVTSQTDEADITRAELSGNSPLVVVAGCCCPMIDAECIDAGASRNLQTASVGAIRNHDSNDGIQPPIADGIDERLKIAASARDENAKPAVHSRFT